MAVDRSSDPAVVGSAVRSLALVANLLEDEDKLPKVRDLVLGLVVRHVGQPEVRGVLEASLLPVLAVWLREQDRGLYYDFLERILLGIRESRDSSTVQKV